MSHPVIVHVSADVPDCMVAAKTPTVINLIETAPGFRHIVYSLNRVSWKRGIVALPFAPDRKALAYGAPPRGIMLESRLAEVAACIIEDLRAQGITPDLLHLHKFTVEGLIGLRLREAFKCPMLVNIWGDSDLKIIDVRRDLGPRWQAILDQASAYLPCAPWTEGEFARRLTYDRSRSIVLPPIAQKTQFTPSPVVTAPRFVSMFNLDSHRRKNLASMAAAVMQARRTIPGLTLDIFGRGAPESVFAAVDAIRTAGAVDAVRLMGPLSAQDFASTLVGYVGFAMPSRRETFGMVFPEALFCGLPLLFTKGWGVDGFLPSEQIGYAADAASIADIRAGFEQLWHRQAELKASVAALHARGALDCFTRAKIGASYVDTLNRVLAGRESGPR